MDTIARLLERPDETFTIQYRLRHKDGRWRWIENVANTFVRGSADSGLMANCRDITERVEAERALRERDMHFRRLIENAERPRDDRRRDRGDHLRRARRWSGCSAGPRPR
jgi:PAS domain-containing protein